MGSRIADAIGGGRPLSTRALKFLSALVFALYGCTTISSRPEELQRTWDAAQVRVVYGGVYAIGAMRAASNQDALSKLPPDLKLPTVIYLHGCSGVDLEHQTATMGQLLKAGFAVIAPDSFALTNRTAACGTGAQYVYSVRGAEAKYAADKAKALKWVDSRNLFLLGHSEGGAGAAVYGGKQFNAIVISGFHCPRGIGSDVPTLAVAYRHDHQIRGAASICPGASEHLILEGTSHHILQEDEVAARVVAFLKRYRKR